MCRSPPDIVSDRQIQHSPWVSLLTERKNQICAHKEFLIVSNITAVTLKQVFSVKLHVVLIDSGSVSATQTHNKTLLHSVIKTKTKSYNSATHQAKEQESNPATPGRERRRSAPAGLGDIRPPIKLTPRQHLWISKSCSATVKTHGWHLLICNISNRLESALELNANQHLWATESLTNPKTQTSSAAARNMCHVWNWAKTDCWWVNTWSSSETDLKKTEKQKEFLMFLGLWVEPAPINLHWGGHVFIIACRLARLHKSYWTD